MAVTQAAVIALAPELASVPPAVCNAWIAALPQYLHSDMFADSAEYDHAGTLWVAHVLTVGGAGTGSAGAVGPVTGMAVDGVRIDYQTPQAGGASLSGGLGRTAYGQILSHLLRLAALAQLDGVV